MNNETVLSQMVYEQTVQTQCLLAASALFLYASLLHFSDEVEYIWKRKFTLPTLLYLFAKYPLFLNQAIQLTQMFLSSASVSVCNDLGISDALVNLFPLMGVQGLISIRAYSLCRGSRPMAIALSLTFATSVILQIYQSTLPACSPIPFSDFFALPLVVSVAIIFADILAFIAVIRQVWGVWKLKRSLGLQTYEDLVASLFKQGVIRFCFVIFISIAATTLTNFPPASIMQKIGIVPDVFQDVLSVLLICEFTMDLRRRNDPRSVVDQPITTLSFQDNPAQSVRLALGRLHESIVAEMGENNSISLAHIDECQSDDLQSAQHEEPISFLQRCDDEDIELEPVSGFTITSL